MHSALKKYYFVTLYHICADNAIEMRNEERVNHPKNPADFRGPRNEERGTRNEKLWLIFVLADKNLPIVHRFFLAFLIISA